jgi:hypothetical protein
MHSNHYPGNYPEINPHSTWGTIQSASRETRARRHVAYRRRKGHGSSLAVAGCPSTYADARDGGVWFGYIAEHESLDTPDDYGAGRN